MSGNFIKSTERGWNKFDKDCVERINKIVETANAEVVISSAWRLDAVRPGETAISRLERILRENGARFPVKDVTPFLHTDDAPWVERGLEIQAWISDNKFEGHFVIIDDDEDMAHL